MTLKNLEISLQQWGEHKGDYEVKISVTENRNEIQMVLPSEIGRLLVEQTKDFIHQFSRKAADDLHRELLLAKPEVKQIES